MGEPIRWDTIMSRTPDSAPGMATAAGLINNGFSSLQGLLKENQTVQNQNFDNHTKLNTATFQDAVAKYQNTDDLKKAMGAGGELDVLRQQLGPNINHDAIRGAADARMMGLMQQKQQEITFNHAMTDEATAGAVQQYKAARLNNDQAGMDRALGEYQAKNGRDLSGLIAYGDARGWELKNRDLTVRNSDDVHNTSVSSITHQREMEKIGNVQAGAAVTQAGAAASQAATSGRLANYQIETGTQDRKVAQAAGMAAAIKASLGNNGNVYADGIYTGGQSDEARKMMKDYNVGDGNSDKQGYVMQALDELRAKGITVKAPNGTDLKGPDGKPIIIRDIPMAAVKAAISGATGDGIHMLSWNTVQANQVKDNLAKILSATTTDSKGQLVSKVLNDLSQYTEATNRVTENAPAIAPSRTPSNVYGGGKRK